MLATRSRAAAGLLTALLLLAGCGDDAASAQGIARNDLVAAMATQLTASATLTYTAAYHLAGGGAATLTQAQNPPRASYDFPAGRLLITGETVTACRAGKPSACTVTSRADGGAPLPAKSFGAAQQSGLAAPATVLALLDAAALDAAVTVQASDTTIAGHHATCLALSGVDDASAREFSTCVTNDGVLGSFDGNLGGADIDMTMTEFEATAPAGAFDPPAGARITDHRKPA